MGGIRRIKSTMFRHMGGTSGKSQLAELRAQREAGKEIRDEDAAEASVDQPPRKRVSWRTGQPPDLRGTFCPQAYEEAQEKSDERLAAWHAAAGERVIKRLNNVYRLRDERKGIVPEVEPVPAENETENKEVA